VLVHNAECAEGATTDGNARSGGYLGVRWPRQRMPGDLALTLDEALEDWRAASQAQILAAAMQTNAALQATPEIKTDFARFPIPRMQELIDAHLATKSSDGQFVSVIDVAGDQVRYYLFERSSDVDYAPDYSESRARLSAHPRVIARPEFYQLVKTGTLSLVNKVDENTRLDLLEGMIQAWRKNASATNDLVAAYKDDLAKNPSPLKIAATVVIHMLPGVSEVDYARRGEWGEFTISLAGDLAMLLTGPIAAAAKAARTAKGYRLAKAAYVSSAAIQAGVAGYRTAEAIYELRNSDGSKLAAGAYIGEAILRMFGVRMAVNGARQAGVISELAQQGVKFTESAVVWMERLADGRIVFLERGTPKSGLLHIIEGHGKDFAARGISENQIPSAILQALKTGRVVGTAGSGANVRSIYEFVFNGRLQRIAVGISPNGYVVTAFPN
jgi:hypothetical protein